MGRNRRIVLTVLVAAMVVLAGCGGDGGGGDDPTTTDGATTTVAPGTTDPGGTETTAGDGPTATTTSGDGTTTDPGDAGYLSEHVRNLRAGGGYAAEFSFAFDNPSTGDASMTGEVRANVNTGAQWQSVQFSSTEGGDVTWEQYLPPGGDTVSMCTRMDGDCAQIQEVPVEGASSNGFYNFTVPFIGQVRPGSADYFSDGGTVDTDDGERRRYVIDEVSQLPDEATSTPQGTLVDVQYEVLVDPATGLATDFDYQTTIETSEGEQAVNSVEFSYTEFGDVQVEAPGWYGE